MPFNPYQGFRIPSKNTCYAVNLSMKAGIDNCGVCVKSNIPFKGYCKEVAFSAYSGSFRSGQSVSHFSFLVVHHFTNPGASKTADSSTNRCSPQGTFSMPANHLPDYRTCCSTAGSSICCPFLSFCLSHFI